MKKRLITKKPLITITMFTALIFILFAQLAAATHITMSTEASAVVIDGFVEINIETVNSGDEAAHNVQFSVALADKAAASGIKPLLNVNERFAWNKKIEHGLEKPGRYPVIVTTNYEDANGYPFTALTTDFANYMENTISDVFGTIDSLELSKKASLKIRIKNNGNS